MPRCRTTGSPPHWAPAACYDRPFDPQAVFELQDDLVPRIVSSCGDDFGVPAPAISEAVRGRPLDDLTPYEALMRGFGYHVRLDAEEHASARGVRTRRRAGTAQRRLLGDAVVDHGDGGTR